MVSSPTGAKPQSMPRAATVSPISARFCAPSFSSSGISAGKRDRPLPMPWVRLAEQKPPFRPDAAQPVVSASRSTISAEGSRSRASSAVHSPENPPPTTARSAVSVPVSAGAGSGAPGWLVQNDCGSAPASARTAWSGYAHPSGSFGIIEPRSCGQFRCERSQSWPASRGDGRVSDSGRAPPARFRAARGPRRGGDEDKGLRLAVFSPGHEPRYTVRSFILASRRGQSRREEMIMTQNKAQKAAARQRMAQTGEPYSVARRATAGDHIPPEGPLSPEEQYAREAEAAGLSTAETEAHTAAFRVQEAADRARYAAEQARDLADRAEGTAEQAEQRAMQAQEAAEQAEEWADQAELERMQARAGVLQEASEQAREQADRAEEMAEAAEERAEMAQDAADEAQEEAAEKLAGDAGPWHETDTAWDETGRAWEHPGRVRGQAGAPWDEAQAARDEAQAARDEARAAQQEGRIGRFQDRAGRMQDRIGRRATRLFADPPTAPPAPPAPPLPPLPPRAP